MTMIPVRPSLPWAVMFAAFLTAATMPQLAAAQDHGSFADHPRHRSDLGRRSSVGLAERHHPGAAKGLLGEHRDWRSAGCLLRLLLDPADWRRAVPGTSTSNTTS